MDQLKGILLSAEVELEESFSKYSALNEVEVVASSIPEALSIASRELRVPVNDLKYTVIREGHNGLFGIGKMPYQLFISKKIGEHLPEQHGTPENSEDGDERSISEEATANVVNRDGKAIVRLFKRGVCLKVIPEVGSGLPSDLPTALKIINSFGIIEFDKSLVAQVVKEKKNVFVIIASFRTTSGSDSKLSIILSPDEMNGYVNIQPPKPGGLHLEVRNVEFALKRFSIIHGIDIKSIEDLLDDAIYNINVVVARGDEAVPGKNAYIDYKVNIDKNKLFEADSQGRIDFFKKDILENVVQNQLLAEVIPAGKGEEGCTVTGKKLPTRSGVSIELKPGKGTILSSDQIKLFSEKNGQVVFLNGKLNVEDVYVVHGDAGLTTGNISFLGSVRIVGSVVDNTSIRAVGNIGVGGNVQKAFIEAEGDVLVRGGVQGRNSGVIESTNGSIFAKYVQNVHIIAEKDLLVSEAIMHSNVSVGEMLMCYGNRAQMIGGVAMVGREIRAKSIGAQASTPTKLVVGVNPKILTEIHRLEALISSIKDKISVVEQTVKTLQSQSDLNKISNDKMKVLFETKDNIGKFTIEMQQLQGKVEVLQKSLVKKSGAGVHIQKTLYPGVSIEINDAIFEVRDEYRNVSLVEANGSIKIIPYCPLDASSALRKDTLLLRL